MSILKGIGIGLMIGGLWSYLGVIPVLGGYLVSNATPVMVVLGLVLFFVGQR
ncbi:MAG: hypothetical protein GXP63_04445 [DPANN group archaeon]|nr:hypothetical protein [DPANN group archaeon]